VPPTPNVPLGAEAIDSISTGGYRKHRGMTTPAATARPAPQPLPIPTASGRIVMTPVAESDNAAYFGYATAMIGGSKTGSGVNAATGGAVLDLRWPQ